MTAHNRTRRSGVTRQLKSQGVWLAALLLSVSSAACDGTLGGHSGGAGATGSGSGSGAEPGTIDENGNKVFPPPEFDLEGAPLYSRAVLLTNAQWANSVQEVLALPEPPTQANGFLEPVQGFTLFPNNENVLLVTNELRESYQLAAAELALEVLADPAALTRINAGGDADSFIRTFGRRAFRRPLTDEEVTQYLAIWEVGTGLSGTQPELDKGANLVIEAMLQSPHFLYRTELTPDGEPLSAYEVAAKLSFWILGTSPSDAVLDRVAAGELDTTQGVSLMADEMLADPAAGQMIVDLYASLFKFARYRDVIKDDPMYSPEVNAELEEVSRLFFEHIYAQDLGLDEILTSTQGFVGPQLAKYYGVSPAPAAPTLTELGPERPGYFSHVPYLMLMGHGASSDAIHRGVFLNFQVMCAGLPSPPGDIPEVPPKTGEFTDRQNVENHTGFGTCGEGCHGGYINPLGFAFENFDGLGRVRTEDNGQAIDTVSAYPVTGEGMVEFNGAPELMPLLAGTQEAHGCFAKSLMSYALSRDIVEADQETIDELTTISMSETGSIKSVLRALVNSQTFLSRPGAI